MDYSDRRYNKPKVLKKKKYFNKYKQQNVDRNTAEEAQNRISIPLGKLNKTKSNAAPGMTKVNRGDRLTVQRGLFDKSKKSRVAFRDNVNRSEQVARLNEDLDAIIPSCNDEVGESQFLHEENNNITSLSPNIWESQHGSDHKPSPAHRSTSTNHNQSHRNPSSSLKPSTNQFRSHRSPSPVHKRSTNRNQESCAPRSRSSRSSRSLAHMEPRDLAMIVSPDHYPRTRAYVNAQRERIAKFGAKAFELSSESEEEEQTRNHEHINKYLELMSYMEKKFVPVKRVVFKGAPCQDYFKKIKSELLDTYEETGRKAQISESLQHNTWLSNQAASTRENDFETLSVSSDDTQANVLPHQKPREFIFSPHLAKSPVRTSLPQYSPCSTVFPQHDVANGSYDSSRSYRTSHGLHQNEMSYDDTGWRPLDFNHQQRPDYYGNYAASWSNPNSLRLTRVRSPELATRKRPRPNNYESQRISEPRGFDSNSQRFDDFDYHGGCSNHYDFSSNPRTTAWRTGYHTDSQRSSVQYNTGSYVLSPNPREPVAFGPRNNFVATGFNNMITLDPHDDSEDSSPPIKFYPRKLF